MFRRIVTKKNKQPKHPKATHQDYLYTERRLYNNMFASVSLSELERHSSINDLRHAFKRTAKRIRTLYAAKEPQH